MDCNDVTLEFARYDEASAIARMSRDLIEAGLGWSYRPGRIAELIADPDTIVVVAREAGAMAGFAVMSFGDERAHLVLLAVGPSFRRRGIARRLVQWLLESAQVAGIASVHVELRADNAAAHALYRSLGFAATIRVSGYYRGREAAIRMLRLLRPVRQR